MTHLTPPDRRPGWVSAPTARGKGRRISPTPDRSSLKMTTRKGIRHLDRRGESLVTTTTERTGHEH